MGANLSWWQQRLEKRFGELKSKRASQQRPIFALEHGLSPDEILELNTLIREHIIQDPPYKAHDLAWVVYAAEIGYGYSGEEYWQTFEELTPGWDPKLGRERLRSFFWGFVYNYNGAEPSGAWAENFSIIALPITHAILPKDLQQQLAKALHSVRNNLYAEHFENPELLGELVTSHSGGTSARFQNFIQATELVGQIAAALLLHDVAGTEIYIDPIALKRIANDVAGERQSREWLHAARHSAKDRVHLHGLSSIIGTRIQTTDEARSEIEKLGIEPRLVLRPVAARRWEVLLEMSNLSPLLSRFPTLGETLRTSRAEISGAEGRPLARGRLLYGKQRITLDTWPQSDTVLLKFERQDSHLEFLLKTECMLRPSPWLFKIASDGLAYELRGAIVHPGSKYLFVSVEPLSIHDLTQPVELTCKGVYATMLMLPPELTPEWEEILRQFSIPLEKHIQVWPAGLAAMAWDGEGHSEWYSSETPILAIWSDHIVEELTIAISDDSPPLLLRPDESPPGGTLFVELPRLDVGIHKLSVVTRGRGETGVETIGELELVVRVREAQARPNGETSNGLFEVTINPDDATLEQLWQGKVSVAVYGPHGRQISCRMRMFRRQEEEPLFELTVPPVELPTQSEEWLHRLETQLRKLVQDHHERYDDGDFCDIEFSADELGSHIFRFEREFSPLRWSFQKDPNGFVLRLRDSADDGAMMVERYSFNQPTIGQILDSTSEYRVPPDGGLYSTIRGKTRATIIAPPDARYFSNWDSLTPQTYGSSNESIQTLLSYANLWSSAGLTGVALGRQLQRETTQFIARLVWSALGGNRWKQLEEEFARGEISVSDLRSAVPEIIGGQPKFDSKEVFPRESLKKIAKSPIVDRLNLFATFLLNKHLFPSQLSHNSQTWLAQFSLRLASAPSTLESWAGGDIQFGVSTLSKHHTLARAARFLVLAVAQVHMENNRQPTAGEIYSGWGWLS